MLKAYAGDVVLIDEGLVYKYFSQKYKAIVLWNGINGQPLLTEVGKWKPQWGEYETIAEVLGKVDLEEAVKWDG